MVRISSHPLSFKEFATEGLKKAATFIYDMPLVVPAALASGVALRFLYPGLAPPALGFGGAIVLTRLVVKVIEIYNDASIKEMKDLIYRIHRKIPKIEYVAFAVSLLVALLAPLAGFLLATGIGIYKALLIEIEIYQLKQQLDRESHGSATPATRINLMNV